MIIFKCRFLSKSVFNCYCSYLSTLRSLQMVMARLNHISLCFQSSLIRDSLNKTWDTVHCRLSVHWYFHTIACVSTSTSKRCTFSSVSIYTYRLCCPNIVTIVIWYFVDICNFFVFVSKILFIFQQFQFLIGKALSPRQYGAF